MKEFLIIVFFISIAQVLCQSKKLCPKITPAPVDEIFVKGKFDTARHSDTEMFRRVKKKHEFMGEPKEMKSVCWDSLALLEDGSEYRIKVKCDYENISSQFCNIEKEDQEKFLATKGSVTYTSTDNSTYIAGIACIEGIGAFWWIASKSGHSVDSAAEKSAFEIFEKAGLDTTKVATKDSPIVFKGFTLSDDKECK